MSRIFFTPVAVAATVSSLLFLSACSDETFDRLRPGGKDVATVATDSDAAVAPVGRENRRERRKLRMEAELARFDADGDGVLSDTERAAARAARRAEHQADAIAKFDTDGDGVLSDTERAAARTARREEMQAQAIEEFDADGDGKLNREERKAARAAYRANRVAPSETPPPEPATTTPAPS